MAGQTTTIQFDEQTRQHIDALRETFGATSTASVIRKALALASIVARQATPERTVTISGKDPAVVISLAT